MDKFSPFDLTGKVALVTGAGRGIGRSAAIALAQANADVAVVSRTKEETAEVVRCIQETGHRGLAVNLDLGNPENTALVIEATIREFGRLDILVNCAGRVVRKRAEDTVLEDWDAVLNLNLKSLGEMCRLALPHLRRNPGANIVNMSSITGMVGTPMRAAYASTKMAIIGYTHVLAKELAPEGIRVNAVCPGFIDTAFVTPYLKDKPGVVADVLRHIPLGRMGTPEESAWPILFLASPAASYITGQALVIDGGWMLY